MAIKLSFGHPILHPTRKPSYPYLARHNNADAYPGTYVVTEYCITSLQESGDSWIGENSVKLVEANFTPLEKGEMVHLLQED